jgi:hypothetical protein
VCFSCRFEQKKRPKMLIGAQVAELCGKKLLSRRRDISRVENLLEAVGQMEAVF